MAFKPAHRPALFLPIPLADGSTKVYKILAPSAATGLLISQAFTLGQARAEGRELTPEEEELLDLSGDKEEQFDRDLFGGQKQQMLDDGVDQFTFGVVRQTTMLWVQAGKAAAEAFWNAATSEDEDDDPEDETGPKENATSDVANKDQPDSTDGSTTPKPRKKAARKRASAGSTSTATGTSSKPTSSNDTGSTVGTVDF